jgi:F0F1-type ATP synthase assembly protein I
MKEEKKDDKFSIIYPISLVTQIGVTVSVTASIFILGGKFLDEYFHAAPLFILLGGIIAFIASMYMVYRLVLPMTDKRKGKANKK